MSRYTDIAGEPVARILPPIPDYENVPVVTLEEALKPVSHFFNGIDWYVWVAKENSLHPIDGLTPDESASIYLYTMSCSNGLSLYQLLNQHLREDNRETLRPWSSFLKLFLTALRKLPSHSRTVWRGVQDTCMWGSYPPGGHVSWWGVSSCTSTQSVLESAENLAGYSVKTIFSIECQHAKMINGHSRDKDNGREEFVLLPGTCFEVIDRVRSEGACILIYLKEIDSISLTSAVAWANFGMAHEPSRAEIQTVLSYLEIFYPNGEPYDPIDSSNGDESATYKPEVKTFFELIVNWCDDLDFGYIRRFFLDPEKMSTASWKELKQILLFFTRQERNGPYAYSRAIQYGYIRRILLRMKELFP